MCICGVPDGEAGMVTKKSAGGTEAASVLIDRRIAELGDWRGETLAQLRELLKAAVPGVVEEWKWNNPVWSYHGILCTGEAYKSAVKTTFAKGALVPDPAGLFNASLEGHVRRAIDFREGQALDKRALRALFKAAAEVNEKSARG